MDTLRQIIQEELNKVLYEEREKRKRARIGKSDKTGTWTSAGTVPYEKGRKMSDEQIKNRKEIGKKLLNLLRRGGAVGKSFRDKINSQLDKRGKPTNRMHQYSMVWANASDIALKGGTSSDISASGRSKKKSKPSQAPKAEEQ
jgi:hypothetical protein